MIPFMEEPVFTSCRGAFWEQREGELRKADTAEQSAAPQSSVIGRGALYAAALQPSEPGRAEIHRCPAWSCLCPVWSSLCSHGSGSDPGQDSGEVPTEERSTSDGVFPGLVSGLVSAL